MLDIQSKTVLAKEGYIDREIIYKIVGMLDVVAPSMPPLKAFANADTRAAFLSGISFLAAIKNLPEFVEMTPCMSNVFAAIMLRYVKEYGAETYKEALKAEVQHK